MPETLFQINDLIENRYRVLSVIGSGGMGALYQVADEVRDGEILGLKTIGLNVLETEQQASIERFRSEFKLLTQLRHPNLISVYDFGITLQGGFYFTMEWVKGRILEPAARSMEPAATIPLMVQICRALSYLHGRGVIHGDLKPHNVLLIGEQVRIIDFGVSRETRSIGTGAQYSSPGYSAPELGEQEAVDLRADLYSLGALWYALLVGEPPNFMFGAEELIRMTLEDVLQGQLPPAIADVISRLLARAPEGRFSQANEVITALNQATGEYYTLETRETARSYALRGRFVGRETELSRLQGTWEQVKRQESKLVLIEGESGVGKTRLAEEFVVQAELEGAWAARGQCMEREGLAYRPWREVLRVLIRYIETSGTDTLQRIGPVIAALLPELWQKTYLQGQKPPAELAAQAAQHRLNDALNQTLCLAAQTRPTVVVIEDGQFADEATLVLLDYLARVSGQPGLLICVTYRREEISREHLLVSLERDRVERISLQNLLPENTDALLLSMLGLENLPEALTRQVQQTSGGNAFFTQELVRSLAEEGTVLQRTVDGWRIDTVALRETRLPDTIHQVVERRLGHLSAPARQVLGWAALIGVTFWDGALEAVGRVSKAKLQDLLEEGKERALLAECGPSAFIGERAYRFINTTSREKSYESIPSPERSGGHNRAAAWALKRSDQEKDEHLGWIADHSRSGLSDPRKER